MNNNQDLVKRNKILERRWKIMLVLVIIFIVTRPIALYIVKNVINKSVNEAIKNEYIFLDPARKFLDASNYIVNIQNFRTYLHDLEEKYPENVSIYYEQLNSGANISVNKELKLFPASLSKLVQAILILNKVEKGELNLDKKLKIAEGDISSDSGDLYKRVKAGDELSVEELLKELLVNSDNTAQNVFRHQLEISDYLKFQDETGLQDLYNEKGFISAKEYTRILRVLYTSSFLKPENSEKILECMSQATFKDYLSAGIPEGIKFAHKYGENKEYNIFADSGIVYVHNQPYMLTVLIKGKDSSEETRMWAVALMKEISEKAYEVSK